MENIAHKAVCVDMGKASIWLRRWADQCNKAAPGATFAPGAHAPCRRCPFAIFISAQVSKFSKLTAKELLAETKLFLGCMYEMKRLWMNFRF